MRETSDTELMGLVQGGDFGAFDELYRRHHCRIRRFLLSLTWDPDLAEDYLQEVFVRLWKARDKYQPSGKFASFLFRIAKNHYLSERRKLKSRGDEQLESPANSRSGAATIRASVRTEPEAHLLESYRLGRIHRAIARLPEAQKMVFVLGHLEGLNQAEISQVLEIPVGTVKSRMWAAVRSLQRDCEELIK